MLWLLKAVSRSSNNQSLNIFTGFYAYRVLDMTYKRKKKFVLLDVLVEIPRDGQMHQWSAEPYFCLWEENTRTAG